VQITPVPHSNEDGTALGDPNAPVKIEVFKDFQCSACKSFSQAVEPQVISELVEAGKVYYIFHQYPFMDDRSGVKDSDNGAHASMCAAEQNRFWDYKSMLFANLNYVAGEFNDKRMLAFAEALGLDMAEFESCYNDRRYQDEIDQDIALGEEYGVTGTPSIFVNGQIVKPGYVPSFEEIAQAVEAALSQ
jgi:protein-disulfide isomerase